jgi:hypothetical protein
MIQKWITKRAAMVMVLVGSIYAITLYISLLFPVRLSFEIQVISGSCLIVALLIIVACSIWSVARAGRLTK